METKATLSTELMPILALYFVDGILSRVLLAQSQSKQPGYYSGPRISDQAIS